MKKIISLLTAIGMTLSVGAQEQEWTAPQNKQENGWLNHLDIAVAGGTGGIGFDIATPLTEWAQLRIGGEFRPFKTYRANFGLEIAEGLTKGQQDIFFSRVEEVMQATIGMTPKRKISMEGSLKMNNFKMLVDVFPLKNHKNFHVTIGFYYGNGNLLEAANTSESIRNLAMVNAFNALYDKAKANQAPIDFTELGIDNAGDAKFEAAYDKLLKWGMLERDFEKHYDYMTGATMEHPLFSDYGMSVPIGTYMQDVVAPEDIYWDNDEYLYNVSYDNLGRPHYTDGTYFSEDFEPTSYRHRKGEIRYRKGEVVRKAGDAMRVVPDDENMVRVKAVANKFKPYLGVGYSMPITKDGRTQIGIDAGLLFWGGTPAIIFSAPLGTNAQGETIYHDVDLVRDLNHLPSSVQDYVDRISKYPVFPELTLRFSQRIW